MSVGIWAVLGIVAAGLVAFVVQYIRRAIGTSVALDQRDAALQVEQERVSAMEAAAAREREARQSELEHRISTVTTPESAAKLLGNEFK